MKNVHVFIVNYNSVDLLKTCLESLRHEPVESIHVIDNYSSPSEREAVVVLPSVFPRVHVALRDSNVGFGPALNHAIENSEVRDDDIVWILNPDTNVSPGTVAAMTEFMQEGYDIVSPVILTGDPATPRVWFAGGVLDRRQVRTVHAGLGSFWGTTATQSKEHSVNTFITGAAMMMQVDTWKKVGGFREGFFLYWEDAELSEKAVRMGFRLGVATSAHIWHAVGGSGSSSGMSGTYYYYMQRNRLWFGRQWQSRLAILLGPGLRETLALTLRPLKEKEGRVSKTLSSFRGLMDGAIRAPL
ncbi:glycosyltransferase family 2 protein [Arthrobacter sp. zg-Y859]|uniref:Glycosyltransferase family 2 protein n=1 Tax=Arthrobacter jinronghuae TaxID=2964609 RepID=A0ABT1NTM1_9MICC|nr:glycosyltransferase family 2 protein [Arthrobacter jinronghuae]MCQ1951081.1 glycosyltransferase family 2 protein [Arthrobacter jinronghuae]UWX79531.1 glycosyltransferase family 2 protein [Arthrobacter jinronghuae]